MNCRSVELAIAVAVAGCGGSGTTNQQPLAQDAGVSLCATDPRAQTFAPNMEQTGTSGVFRIRLVSIEPVPVEKGDNTWTIQVLSASDAPVSGATLTLKPFMPDHGHGSSILPLFTPSSSAGVYTVSRINLFMPGIWVMTFGVDNAGSSDSVAFTFCVPD